MKRHVITAFLVLAPVLSAYAELVLLSTADQYQKASNAVRAKHLDSRPAAFPDFVGRPGVHKGFELEYTISRFLVLEEYKGKTGTEGPNMITVIAQTKHDWDCPTSMKFEKGSEYLLFLNRTPSRYLFNVVTDTQASMKADKAAIQAVRKLGEKK